MSDTAPPPYPDEAISAGALALGHGDYPGCSCISPQEHADSLEGDRYLAEMILDAAAPVITTAGRERWVTVLAGHYLMGINCDHETKRDNPMCGCSRIDLGWHDSIGEARQAWIAHVASVVAEAGAG